MSIEFRIWPENSREARYAAAALAALADAMESGDVVEPLPAKVGQTVSRSSGPMQNDQIAEDTHSVISALAETTEKCVGQTVTAGFGSDPQIEPPSDVEPKEPVVYDEHGPAAPTAEEPKKRRGRPRKSEQKLGDALQGATAADLQAALQNMPLVSASEGVEVRVAADTSATEIANLKARLAVPAEETSVPAADTGPDLSFLSVSEPESAPPTLSTAEKSEQELQVELVQYANGRGGITWLRSVVAHYGKRLLTDLTVADLRDAMSNPDRFNAAA